MTSRGEPRDAELIALLKARDGRDTRVILRDGTMLRVLNIAWGYDMGEVFAHVTTNCSPIVDGASIDVFYTSDVTGIRDPADGSVLFPDP